MMYCYWTYNDKYKCFPTECGHIYRGEMPKDNKCPYCRNLIDGEDYNIENTNKTMNKTIVGLPRKGTYNAKI